MKRRQKKILLVKISSLGDVIFNVPLVNILKANGFIVDWITGEKGIDIVKDNPCVNKTYLFPVERWKKEGFKWSHFKEYITLIKELHAQKYDIALDAQMRLKSLPIMLHCGAKVRLITDKARELSWLGATKIIKRNIDHLNLHITKEMLVFAKYLGVNDENIVFTLPPVAPETKIHIDELLKDVDKTKPLVVISPATTWVPKHWNRNYWRELIENIKDKCSLVFTGTLKENELLKDLGADNFTNLAGKTTVKDLIELYSRADIMIGPDSGSTHLARATNKPAVICISTCTPPWLYGPQGDDNKYFSVSAEKQLECQYCHNSRCRLKTDKNICTLTPKPEKIINIVNKLISDCPVCQ